MALEAQTLDSDKKTLNFSTQVGGAATAQTVNITGTGPFTALVDASFLKVNPQTATAPSALTVTADPTGLAAGTYRGDVFVFGSNQGSNQLDIVVTLTVSSISVNPTSLSFAYQTGGNAPPAQTITLSGQATTYSATATSTGTTATSTGNWLQIAAGSGAAGSAITGSSPGTITASVNFSALAVLPPGTANGSIVITPATGSQVTIPVSLQVLAAPSVTANPTSVSLAYQVGGSNNSAQQSVTLSTTSIAGLPFTISTSVDNNPRGAKWILVSPSLGGTIPANGSIPLTISYDATVNLPATAQPGQTGCTSSGCTYTGSVTLLIPNASNPNITIPVSLFVSNSPLLSLPSSTLNFTYQVAGAAPATQNVTVNSTSGATALSLAAATTNNSGNWLTVPATATAGTAFPVSVNPAGLAPGSYTGTITVTANGAANSPLTINVNLKVTNDPVIVYTANGCSTTNFSTCPLTFLDQLQQFPAPSQSITISSSTGAPLTYTATTQVTSCGNNWLAIGGATSGGTDGIISVAVAPTGIAAGTKCDGNILITATNTATGVAAPNSPLQIPVSLYVSNTPLMAFAPSALVFTGQVNGAATASQTITLASTSATDSITYNVNFNTSNGNWLFVSPENGTAGPAGSSLTVFASPGLLSAGVYTGTITVTAQGPGGATVANSPLTIPVVFQVNAGTIKADATSLNFTQAAGGSAPAAQTVNLTGTPNAINYAVTATADNGGTWLSVTPASGTTPGAISVSASAGNLAVGTYNGKVTITAATPPGATGSPITIPVTLNVVTGQTLTASPNNVSFNAILGGAAPPNQTVAVATTGTTAVPFTVAVSPSTATWLTVTPTSGNTPGTLTFAANPAGLAVGKYTATATVNSSSASSPATVTVTLTITNPVPAIVTSITNAASYATGGISPGENITLFGTGMGPATLATGTVTNGVWNTTAGGVQVFFDGVAAPVIYASATATSVMVPYGVAGRASTVVTVSYQNVTSTPVTYNVVQAVPGVYSQNASGTGPGSILNQDNSINGPTKPAAANSVIAVYMTGEGQTSPAGTDGKLAPIDGTGLFKPTLPVTATIAGQPANVEYYGSAPGILYGVMQVNIRVPAGTPSGAQPLVIKVGNFSSQTGITVTIQ